jgi:hypothetical protein
MTCRRGASRSSQTFESSRHNYPCQWSWPALFRSMKLNVMFPETIGGLHSDFIELGLVITRYTSSMSFHNYLMIESRDLEHKSQEFKICHLWNRDHYSSFLCRWLGEVNEIIYVKILARMSAPSELLLLLKHHTTCLPSNPLFGVFDSGLFSWFQHWFGDYIQPLTRPIISLFGKIIVKIMTHQWKG